MNKLRFLVCAGCTAQLLVQGLWAQNQGVKARDLFYEENGPTQQRSSGVSEGSSASAVHLALRYNLLLVDPSTRKAQAVDPDGMFKAGDCFAVEFSPNREGRMYVFSLGSSGQPELLLPSSLMPEETAWVKPGAKVRVPQDYCFQLDHAPGTETLMVVVAAAKDDIQGIDGSGAGRFNSRILQWQQRQIAHRDIVIQKLDQPQSAAELPHAVYFATPSAEAASGMVLEIKIRHE